MREFNCIICGTPKIVANNEPKARFCTSKCYHYSTHESFKGKKNPFYGKRHSEATKKIIKDKRKFQVTTEETRKKMRLSRIGHPCAHGKGGYREDLHHYVRSSWEANVARIFLLNGIGYEYEKHRFILEDCSYCPDFYLPEFDTYIEVKGYLRDGAKAVLYKFIKANPEIKLLVIDREVYKKLSLMFKNKILNWEI